MLTIKTNNRPRELMAFCDMPEKSRADFEYVGADDKFHPRFFQYRGHWYDVCEFMRVPKVRGPSTPDAFFSFDGYAADSYFSGVLIRYVDDFERVIVATYYN